MPRKEINILAVNPGTKYLGLAVFQGTDLVYWGIKVLKGKWSKEKMDNAKATLLNLIGRHNITMLVLKRLNPSRSSRNLNCLVASIEKLAKKKGLRLRLYALSDLQKFLAPNMRVNKLDMAGLVAVRYRFLIHHLEGERKHRHPYFLRMFEAIAAGMFAFNTATNNRSGRSKDKCFEITPGPTLLVSNKSTLRAKGVTG